VKAGGKHSNLPAGISDYIRNRRETEDSNSVPVHNHGCEGLNSSKEFYTSYSLSNIIGAIKSRKLSLVGYVACMDAIKKYR
jgi:hypothetical protein